jgi:hypothetical protein
MFDADGNMIPVAGMHGYGEGLSPMEYWSTLNSSRKGAVDVQMATARSGYLGRQLSNVAHRLVVTSEDCGVKDRGLMIKGDDPDNAGSILMQDAGPFKAGKVLMPEDLPHLENKQIMIRSPLTCDSPEGVCAKCVGIREKGTLPDIGDAVGLNAVRTFIEPLTQAGLCLAQGTQVRMADWSIKNIEDVQIGDDVLGADSKARTFPVKVINTFKQGVKAVYKTVYRRGTSLKAEVEIYSTLNHNILQMTRKTMCKGEVYNGIPRILPAEEPGKYVYAILQEGLIKDDHTTREPFALILGMLLGDGCYTESVKGCFLSCADELLISDVDEYMRSLGLYLYKMKYHDGIYYRVSSGATGGKRDSITGRGIKGGFSNPIMQKLQQYRMLHKYAHEKEIPSEVYSWHKEDVASLIGGLLVTDGCEKMLTFKVKREFISLTAQHH